MGRLYIVADLILDDSRRNYILAFFGVVVFIIFMTFLSIWSTPIPINKSVVDTPILLDGGWRVFQGFRPHNDFSTPLGPITFLFVALGMLLSGPTALSLVSSKIIIAILITIWGWFIARVRMKPFNALIFVLAITSWVITTKYDGGIFETTFAGMFNRYADAFLSIILIELFVGSKLTKNSIFLGGVSTGMLSISLCFLKISYFIFLLPILCVGFATKKDKLPWALGFILGSCGIFIIMLIYLRGTLLPMINDLSLAAKVRSKSYTSYNIIVAISKHITEILPLYVLVALNNLVAIGLDKTIKKRFQLTIVLTFIMICGVFISSTNTGIQGIYKAQVVTLVCALIAFEYLIWKQNNSSTFLKCVTIGFFIISIIFTEFFAGNVLSVIYSAKWSKFKAPSINKEQYFISPQLKDIIVLQEDYVNNTNRYYVERVNDGLSLIVKHCKPDSRIAVLDFSNPFCFALLQKSPHGGVLWWHDDALFTTEEYFYPPELVFKGSNIVMFPKYQYREYYCDARLKGQILVFHYLYDLYLHKFFVKKTESEHWILLEAK